MPGKDLFEYAVIRIVPRVEREEFLNAGVIIYCARQRFLQARVCLDEARIKALYPEVDIAGIQENLASFCRISSGGRDAGPIGQLDAAARFRWLTALRSTVIQTSRGHSGLCTDAAQALDRLYVQLVL